MTPQTEQTVLNSLLEIRESLGSLNTSIEQFNKTISDNPTRITALEQYQDRQRGAAAVWVLVATAIGAFLGYVVEWFIFGKHH